MNGWTGGNIILPLRGFQRVDCGHTQCTQLQAARFYLQNAMHATGQIEIEIQKDRDTDILSRFDPTGVLWNPSVGIKIFTLDHLTRNKLLSIMSENTMEGMDLFHSLDSGI